MGVNYEITICNNCNDVDRNDLSLTNCQYNSGRETMKKKTLFFLLPILIFHAVESYAQIESSKIEVMKISDTIYKLFVDNFVNMIAFVGPDGILLVDSGFEETAEEVKLILKGLGNSDIKYIINTHSDYDHIAGNRSLRASAPVIAHANCRDQMLKYLLNNFSKDLLLISGHGRDMRIGELKEYRKMIVETVEIVVNAMKEGKDVEEMKKENMLKNFESWNSKLFPDDLNTDSWIENIYESLNKKVSN
jgi:hypothetical protein